MKRLGFVSLGVALGCTLGGPRGAEEWPLDSLAFHTVLLYELEHPRMGLPLVVDPHPVAFAAEIQVAELAVSPPEKLVSIRVQILDAAGVPRTDMSDELVCAQGGLIPPRDDPTEPRWGTGCTSTSPHRAIAISPPAGELFLTEHYPEEIRDRFEAGDGRLVRVLDAQVSEVAGATQTFDYVLIRDRESGVWQVAERTLIIATD